MPGTDDAEGIEHAVAVEQQCDGLAAPQVNDERSHARIATDLGHFRRLHPRGKVVLTRQQRFAQTAIAPEALGAVCVVWCWTKAQHGTQHNQ